MPRDPRPSGSANVREVITVLVVLACVVVLILSVVTIATSQPPARRASDALILARITIHEAGWEDTGDMEAIHAVLAAGAEREGLSFRAYANAYAGELLDGNTTRSWAAEVTEACTAPSSWPEYATRNGAVLLDEHGTPVRHAPWSAYRDRCLDVMERSRETFAGERVHHCAAPPHDWGGVVDRARARRLGLIEVECSFGDVETENDFYQRPSLIEAP